MAKYLNLTCKNDKIALSVEDIVLLQLRGKCILVQYKNVPNSTILNYETRSYAEELYNTILGHLTKNN